MLSLDDFKESMKDVYTTSVCKETIDEAPDAYKKDVETLIGDTVEIFDKLKTVYNFKAKIIDKNKRKMYDR